MFSKKEILEIKELIKSKERITILAHQNPDGDAVGSSLALYHFLKKSGKTPIIILPNEFPKFLKWMPGANKIEIAEYRDKFSEITLKQSEIIFCLDFNVPSRLGTSLALKLEKSKAIKILIDHHEQPTKFDYVYSDTKEPATCQMIYNFIKTFGDEDLIDENIATCLYSGILTDTGSFRFKNTTANTHRIVACLIEKGAKPEIISANILDNNTIGRLKLLGAVFENMEIIPERNAAILYLTKETMEKWSYQKGDTEGIVNYGLSLVGIKFSVFFVEDLYKDYIKISFRSKGDFDVNKFAREYFEGGGHVNAAGGSSKLNMKETIDRFKEVINSIEI